MYIDRSHKNDKSYVGKSLLKEQSLVESSLHSNIFVKCELLLTDTLNNNSEQIAYL